MKRLTEHDWREKSQGGIPWNVHPVYHIDDLPYYKKLAEYEDAEENGKLLRPKCIPGDIVYEANIARNLVSEYEVTCIKYGGGRRFHYLWTLSDGIYSDRDGFYDKDYGVVVFSSREEAEMILHAQNS